MGLSSFAHVQISIVPPHSNGARNFLYFGIQFFLLFSEIRNLLPVSLEYVWYRYIVFDNFSAIFSTELPKRMEREVASLPSLQLWRKSCNKRALDASSLTNVLRKKIGTMCAKLKRARGKVEVSVSRGSLTRGATKLILSSYFITS